MAAIRRQGPDRCPMRHYIFPGAFWRHGKKLYDLAERYHDDFGNKFPRENWKTAQEAAGKNPEEVQEWKDPWGVTWRKLGGYTSGDVIAPAIPDWDAWKSYRFPAPPAPKVFEDFAVQAAEKRKSEYVQVSCGCYFQHLQHMRGPSDMLMDIADDHEGIHELADRLVDHILVSVKGYLAAGVDCVGFGDDLGAQDRLLIHPDAWRRFFKPRYRRLFAPILEAGKDVWFHSDGWLLEIIEDLIEIGVKVFNPQHEIMGTWKVAEAIRGRAAVCTDIDRQWTIPFGTPERIEEDVKRAIAAFGADGGGVILHGEVGPDVPYENVEALYSSFYRYGAYPLDWLDPYLSSTGRARK